VIIDQTASSLHRIVTVAFFATWIILAAVGFFASRRMNAETKRRWMHRWIILIGLLFVLFATTLNVLSTRRWSSLGILFVIVPAVGLISYLNIKLTKFCDNCDATLYAQIGFKPMRFFSRCGAALDNTKATNGDSLLE
jgi:NhaP-type Na+/H+ or K+/H+ antiporter